MAKGKLQKIPGLLTKTFNGWSKGLDTWLPPTEVSDKGFVEGKNVIYSGKDRITKRPGMLNYGGTQDSRVRGGVQYKTSSIDVIIRGSGTTVQKLETSGTITDLTGLTFTNDKDISFAQLQDRLYMANGTEALSYTDDASTITTFTQLSTPSFDGSTPLARGAGLTTGDYTLSYRITAVNDVGETLAATAETVDVDIHPDLWDEADEKVTVKWDRITTSGTAGYKIYGRFTTAENGVGETYLTFVPQPASGASVTWDDTGSGTYPASITQTVPLANTTGGQVFDVIFASRADGRLYGVDYDTDPNQLWFSAGGELSNSFLITDGGGWIKYSAGDGDKIVAVTTLGESIIIAKQKKIGSLSISSINGIAVPSITNINESIGFAGPRSYHIANNDIAYIGFDKRVRVLGNEANFTSIRTAEFAPSVRDTLDSINSGSMERISAFFHEGIFGLSYPSGGSTIHNETIIFDVERGGGGMIWDIGAFDFFTYIDSDNDVRLMGCSETDGYIQEWFRSTKSDNGVAFESRVRFKFHNMDLPYERKIFMEVPVRFRNVSGTLDLNIYIDDEQNVFESIALNTVKRIGGFGSALYKFGTLQFGTYGDTTTNEVSDVEQRVMLGNKEGTTIGVEVVHDTIGDFTLVDYGIVAERISPDYNPGEYLYT